MRLPQKTSSVPQTASQTFRSEYLRQRQFVFQKWGIPQPGEGAKRLSPPQKKHAQCLFKKGKFFAQRGDPNVMHMK